LTVQTGCTVDLERSRIAASGRAAGLLALRAAVTFIARGDAPYILVGGVDSYLDARVLATLEQSGRLRTSEINDGFIPGEAAAFLLVGRAGLGDAVGMPSLARVLGAGTGREPGHFYSDQPYRGDGLAHAFAALFEPLPAQERVRTLYAGLNGESYWAKELGTARIRNSERFEEGVHVEHPADAFGDTGAAMGPVMVGLAAKALRGGYRPGPSLIYCGSDRQDRVAVLLAV
jgi:3-oxoacyl-[acyl-carrier-protein] synthase-1